MRRLRALLRDERGQVLFEYAMLFLLATVLGFLLLERLGELVNALYGRLEAEVSRPSHH